MTIGRSSLPEEVIRAFSADHVVRLTNLSHKQLQYWDRTGFFQPQYAHEARRTPYSRVYSFRDVVGLRTLGILRKQHGIPLQYLRKVAEKLSQYNHSPWSELVLYLFGKEVYFREPDAEHVRAVFSRQYVAVSLATVIHDVNREAEKLKQRSERDIGRVERNRYFVHNAWTVAGTRIPTKAILRFHQAGYSPDRIIREYPLLTSRDIKAALNHEEKLAKRA